MLNSIMATKSVKLLEKDVRDARAHAHRTGDLAWLRQRLAGLLSRELAEGAIEAASDGYTSATVTPLDRVMWVTGNLILSGGENRMNSLWRGQSSHAAAMVKDLHSMHPILAEKLAAEPQRVLAAISSMDDDEFKAAVVDLYGPTGILKLPPDALARPALCHQVLIEAHQELGLDINGGDTLAKKRSTLDAVVFGGSEYRRWSNLAVGSVKRAAKDEARVKAWLDRKPDLQWIWQYGDARSANPLERPAMDWAAHSPALVRHVLTDLIAKVKESPFPALTINRMRASALPSLYLALAHSMEDLVTEMRDLGADVSTLVGKSRLNGSFPGNVTHWGAQLGGYPADWFSIQYHVENCFRPDKFVEAEMSREPCIQDALTPECWPAHLAPADLLGDQPLIIDKGSPLLSGPTNNRGAGQGLTLAALHKLNLVDVSISPDGNVTAEGTTLLKELFADTEETGEHPRSRE